VETYSQINDLWFNYYGITVLITSLADSD